MMQEYQLEIWNGREYEPDMRQGDDGRLLARRYRESQWLNWRNWIAAFGQNGQRTHAWRVVRAGKEHKPYRRPRRLGHDIPIDVQAKAYAEWLTRKTGKRVKIVDDIPMWSLRSGRGNAYEAHQALRHALADRGVSTIGYLLLQQGADQ